LSNRISCGLRFKKKKKGKGTLKRPRGTVTRVHGVEGYLTKCKQEKKQGNGRRG